MTEKRKTTEWLDFETWKQHKGKYNRVLEIEDGAKRKDLNPKGKVPDTLILHKQSEYNEELMEIMLPSVYAMFGWNPDMKKVKPKKVKKGL